MEFALVSENHLRLCNIARPGGHEGRKETRMKTTLYKAVFADYPNNAEWQFKPTTYSELMFILNFLANEFDEDEKGREIRVMALLNGEIVCTNLAAYKLVRE